MSTMRVWRNDSWYELDHKTATRTESGFMHYLDKDKLDNIQAYAEVNQNAFSSITVAINQTQQSLQNALKAGEPVYINADTSMDMITLEGQDGIAITPYSTEKKIVISVFQDSLHRFVTDDQISQWNNTIPAVIDSSKVEPSTTNGNILIDGVETVIYVPETYIHAQTSPSSEWIIIHNLNRRPSVTVVDSADEVVCGDISYQSQNQLTISFSAGFSGKAYLN